MSVAIEIMRMKYGQLVNIASPELRPFAQMVMDQELQRAEALLRMAQDDGVGEETVREALELLEMVGRASIAGAAAAMEDA